MSEGPVSSSTRERLARSVLENNLKVRAGDRVIVEAWTHTLPWAVAFAREARRRGAYPLVPYEDEEAYWDAVDDGEFDVLGNVGAHEWAALTKANVYVHMWGPGDRVRLHALPDERSDRLFAFNPKWYEVAGRAGVRGARLEIGRPFPTLARAYGVDMASWTDQLVRATMVTPKALAAAAAPLVRALGRGRKLRVRDDDGTDLTLGLLRRPVEAAVGRPEPGNPHRRSALLTGLPAGAVRVALDEAVADGTFVSNRTCYYDDSRATGAVFRFRAGKLVDAHFDRWGTQFDTEFRAGGKGRDRPGYFSIGLNPQLHDTPQVEDLEAGAVLVSVGGNHRFGGTNPSPFFGWAVRAGATVEVDGRELPLRR